MSFTLHSSIKITNFIWEFFNNFFSRARHFKFENTILTYGLGVMAWTYTNNLRVVFGPCTQYCPCEASEQKIGQKLKI